MGDDFNWLAVAHDAQLFARTHNATLGSFTGCHQKLLSSPAGAEEKRGGTTCVWYLMKPRTERVHGVARRPVELSERIADLDDAGRRRGGGAR